jgi:hypothetical protein
VQIEVFAYYSDSGGAPFLGYRHESSAARSEKYQVKFDHIQAYDARIISVLCREIAQRALWDARLAAKREKNPKT